MKNHTNFGDEIYTRKRRMPGSAKLQLAIIAITLAILVAHPFLIKFIDSNILK